VAFSFAFLAMLRISNLAPSSSSSFDPLRHLRRGDVTLSSSSLSIHLRWSKTLQRHNRSHIFIFHSQLYNLPSSGFLSTSALLSCPSFRPSPFLSVCRTSHYHYSI
jgi:hypothetical protein